jgi:hypothetical protein
MKYGVAENDFSLWKPQWYTLEVMGRGKESLAAASWPGGKDVAWIDWVGHARRACKAAWR